MASSATPRLEIVDTSCDSEVLSRLQAWLYIKEGEEAFVLAYTETLDSAEPVELRKFVTEWKERAELLKIEFHIEPKLLEELFNG